jgi:hypothetical protein
MLGCYVGVMWCSPELLNFKVHTCHLGILLKGRFWFVKSRVGPEILYFYQILVYGPMATLLSHNNLDRKWNDGRLKVNCLPFFCLALCFGAKFNIFAYYEFESPQWSTEMESKWIYIKYPETWGRGEGKRIYKTQANLPISWSNMTWKLCARS